MFAIVAILCMLFVPLAVFVVFIYAIVLGGEGLIVRHRKKKYQEDWAKAQAEMEEYKKRHHIWGGISTPMPLWFAEKWFPDFDNSDCFKDLDEPPTDISDTFELFINRYTGENR